MPRTETVEQQQGQEVDQDVPEQREPDETFEDEPTIMRGLE